MTIASQLGLEETAFAACLDAPETKARVQQAEAEGARIGVRGTPTFFVNGALLNADDLEADLRQAIEQALQNSDA